jgi:hypothetical protein
MAGSAAKPSEENARSTYTRRLFWLLPTLLLVVFLGDRILNGNNAEVHHQRLEQEFRGVPAPPNSKLIANLDFCLEQPQGERRSSLRKPTVTF